MKRILVVEDERALRILFAEELSEEGYEVCVSCDYAAILDTVRDYKPDLLIFDVRAGNLNDLNLLPDIRTAYRNIPIIICSGCPILSQDMKSWVADFYVIKSADLQELKNTITRALTAGTVRRHSQFYQSQRGVAKHSAAAHSAWM